MRGLAFFVSGHEATTVFRHSGIEYVWFWLVAQENSTYSTVFFAQKYCLMVGYQFFTRGQNGRQYLSCFSFRPQFSTWKRTLSLVSGEFKFWFTNSLIKYFFPVRYISSYYITQEWMPVFDYRLQPVFILKTMPLRNMWEIQNKSRSYVQLILIFTTKLIEVRRFAKTHNVTFRDLYPCVLITKL